MDSRRHFAFVAKIYFWSVERKIKIYIFWRSLLVCNALNLLFSVSIFKTHFVLDEWISTNYLRCHGKSEFILRLARYSDFITLITPILLPLVSFLWVYCLFLAVCLKEIASRASFPVCEHSFFLLINIHLVNTRVTLVQSDRHIISARRCDGARSRSRCLTYIHITGRTEKKRVPALIISPLVGDNDASRGEKLPRQSRCCSLAESRQLDLQAAEPSALFEGTRTHAHHSLTLLCFYLQWAYWVYLYLIYASDHVCLNSITVPLT